MDKTKLTIQIKNKWRTFLLPVLYLAVFSNPMGCATHEKGKLHLKRGHAINILEAQRANISVPNYQTICRYICERERASCELRRSAAAANVNIEFDPVESVIVEIPGGRNVIIDPHDVRDEREVVWTSGSGTPTDCEEDVYRPCIERCSRR